MEPKEFQQHSQPESTSARKPTERGEEPFTAPAPPDLLSPVPTSRKTPLLFGILLLLCIVVAIVVVAGKIMSPPAAEQDEAAPTEVLTRVAVLELQAVPFADRIVLPGTLTPWLSVKLGSEVKGPVVVKDIEEGTTVRKGQILFKIDTDTLETQRDIARTNAELADKQYQRIDELFEQGVVSPEQLDQVENRLEAQKANLRLAELTLEKATVESPVDGVVNHTYAEQGDYVVEGAMLCEIIQTNQLKLKVGVPEKDVVWLKEGQPVTVVVDALQQAGVENVQGTIHKIIPAADEITHTFTVEIALTNEEGLLRPGMIGRAELTRRTQERAIIIPLFAVLRSDNGYTVFLEQAGVARKRTIEIGTLLSQAVQVKSGLQAGERLIIVGQRDLVEGTKVEVVKAFGPEVFALVKENANALLTGNITDFVNSLINSSESTATPHASPANPQGPGEGS